MDVKNVKNIIVVDDDRSIRVVISTALSRAGYNVKSSGTAAGMWRLVESDFADILITDVGLPDGDALDVLPKLQKLKPNLKIIVMSARTTLLTAVRAEKKGAFEYLPKPFDLDELLNLVSNTFLSQKPENNISYSDNSDKTIYDSGPVIGKSVAMQEIYKIISRIVNTDLTVLISGESGTGKKLIAKSIHDLSLSNKKPFINLNMQFFNDYKFEEIIKKFQDISSTEINSIEDISGCSVYIKNITESTSVQQSNFLNFIETDLTQFVLNNPQFIKPRIFASTKKSIYNDVQKGLFREDLYYRLNVVPIKMPSLKDRFEDIPDLTSHFLRKNFQNKLINKTISYEGVNLLKEYSWPGNVRELENVIERLCLLSSTENILSPLIHEVLSEDRLVVENKYEENLETYFKNYLKKYFKDFDENLSLNNLHNNFISKIEKPLIEITLDLFRGNQIKTSKCLGFNRNTLRSKINMYNIEIVKKRKF
ncbi:sigma-54 dependent transcriptional regulator [Alphaproteobacteria bacterium]|nr:sigma-54 dependent transcriptional regulator [Alphaproteobacteria bacterium]